jgi:HD-GYP domain-containing protein (c-di-GMP phosphodiesterase class II)
VQQLLNDQLVSFPVERIIDNSTTDFDLFLRVGDHFILYGSSGYKWNRSELEGLLRNGLTHFLVRSKDQRKIKVYEKISTLPKIRKDEPPHQRIKSITDVAATFIQYLYEEPVTPACVIKGKEIGQAIVECLQEDTTCIQAISGLGDHDYYTYRHSARVAVYSVAMAIQMSLDDLNKLTEIALGGIFHDVGKKEIPKDVLNKTGALTEMEWKLMLSHPSLGFLAVANSILSFVPREIILHHHEKLDGSGYPDGLDKGSLLTEVKIATVADIFDALTSSRAYQNKRSRFESLDFMKNKFLAAKIQKEPFMALIACLGDEAK